MSFLSIVAIETQLMLTLNRHLNKKRAQQIMTERAEEEAAQQEKAEQEFIEALLDKSAEISAALLKKSNKRWGKEISNLKKENERLKEQIESLMNENNKAE